MFPGVAADPTIGQAALESGLMLLMRTLRETYGAEDQATATASIEAFEQHRRTGSMTLLEYCTDFQYLYNQARTLARYEISTTALSHKLLKH